jgi:hypothetical protein
MKRPSCLKVASALVALGIMGSTSTHAAFISLTTTNYLQNFDSLVRSGRSQSLPSGWAIKEFGSEDNQIVADNGSATGGSIYSYGANGSSDRALGSLANKNNYGYFGAGFQNNSGGTINTLNIAYTGEEWRLGAEGRQDLLHLQYSLDATSLGNGTWREGPSSLDFKTPNTVGVGAHDGNLLENQSQIAGSISFLNIPAGGTFWVRWVDAPIPGSGHSKFDGPEDGLAIDNFTITAVPEAATLASGLGMTLLMGFLAWKRGAFRSAKIPTLNAA